MSSNSMDEDAPIIKMLLYKNNEDYRETCDDEVNDMVPRLKRLCIKDNDTGFSMETVSNSMKTFEGSSIADSNEAVYPIFVDDMKGRILVNEVTKAVAGSKKNGSGTEETWQVLSTNTQNYIQSQDVIQKASEGRETHMHPIDSKEEQISVQTNEIEAESVCDESPLNLSLRCNLDHNNEAISSSAIFENKIEFQSLMIFPEKFKHVDPETGEITENSSNILPDTSGSNHTIGNTLDQSAYNKAIGIVSDHSSKLSYSADASSDDQSHRSSEFTLDSPSHILDIGAVKATSVEDKCSRKITATVLPVPRKSEIRQRRFGVFQGPSGIINASKTNYSSGEDPHTPDIGAVKAISVEDKGSRKITATVLPVSRKSEIRQRRFGVFQGPSGINDASKTNYSSDEDPKNSRAIGKNSPKNYRRKCRKTIKSPPRSKALNHSDVKKDEKRPSRCKRKKISSENMTEISGKFRKRSVREHNSETGENTHSVIRSRSLSPGLKNNDSSSVANPPNEKSTISQSRKRTISDPHNAIRVKFRRSSTSSDETEHK